MTRTLVVVTAGLSQPSSTRLLGEHLAAAAQRALEAAGDDVQVSFVELRDLGHDVVNNLLTGFPSAALARAVEQVTGADALIAVTPIFSASYSGLFKSFFDVLDPEALTGTPVLIGATGGSQRHSLALEHALRPLFGYLRALVAPTAVYAASADWGAGDGADALSERIERAGVELAGLMRRMAPIRLVEPAAVSDPFANRTPFAELLGE
jgi:FMN reductase